jgi:putative DNA primase/helicase
MSIRRTGLAIPKAVADATDEYVEEEDSVGRWLEEHEIVSPDPNSRALVDLLYADWSVWAGNSGEPRASKKTLTQTLKARGFRYARDNAGRRGLLGLRIAPPQSADQYEMMRR